MAWVPTYSVVIPPAAPIVTLDDARAYPGVPASAADAFVQAQIDAAIGFLDGPDGYLNRSLGQQTIQCTISTGLGGPCRPSPIALAAGPVLGIVSATGLPGTDSFGAPALVLEGDAIRVLDCFGPTWSGPAPAPIVIQYVAGSPAGVIAAIKPTILAMVAKMIAAAPASARDPTLRSESIPDAFAKSYDANGAGSAFSPAMLASVDRWVRHAT